MLYVVLEFYSHDQYERVSGKPGKPRSKVTYQEAEFEQLQRWSLPCPEMVKVTKAHASAEEKFPCPCLSEWLGLK